MLSPAAWLQLLEKRLDQRWFFEMAVFDAYYEGDHRLAFATEKFREAFAGLFASVADNWCPIVVDSSAERLKVQGFRFGNDQAADDDAWAIWQHNGLDAESDMAHTEAIKLGEAYWLVEPPARGSDDPPRITSEHPSQMIVAHAPGDRRRRLAALKKWVGEDGFAYATLYLPDSVHKWQSAGKLSSGGRTAGRINWTQRRDDPGGANPLGVVPVVPLLNKPAMLRAGQSDLKSAIPLQNAINKMLSDMLIGSEYQAFPQRVLLGVQPPKDENGQPLRASMLQATQSRVWWFSDKDAKTAEFRAADLDNYVNARRHLVEHLTAQTKTPPHYVTGKMVNVSGDALKAGETGLVSKARHKQVTFGEGHEEAVRLALLSTGRDEAPADTETIWRDPESRSFGELVDGLVKLKTLGVPNEVLWERAGFSPQEIGRMKAMQLTDDVFGLGSDNDPASTTTQDTPLPLSEAA